jgi:hypothetical protein
VLEEYGWKQITSPSLPDLPDEDDLIDETEWGLAAYVDQSHREHVKNQTNGVVDTNLKHLWATRVGTTDQLFRQKRWNTVGGRELLEMIVTVDGVTEKVFEDYVTKEINNGALEKVAEGHRKAISWVSDIPSYIPYAGPVISYGIDFLWDAQTSINVATGGSAYLSQYFLDYPVTKDSLGASSQDTIVTTSLDYRGWYVDWFSEGDFYAAGGVCPEDADHLSERLSDAIEEEVDIETPEIPYEQEMLELLTNIE